MTTLEAILVALGLVAFGLALFICLRWKEHKIPFCDEDCASCKWGECEERK